MAEECTDIVTVEEISTFSRWVENRSPIEHLMGILSMKKGNANYLFYNDWLAQEEESTMLQACCHGHWWCSNVCGKEIQSSSTTEDHMLSSSTAIVLGFS